MPTALQEKTVRKNEKLGRRGFLVTASGGLSLGFILPHAGHFFDLSAAPVLTQVNAYIRVGTDNSVTLEFGGCEMGQGTMSGLSQILAEELKVDWTQIAVEQSLNDPNVSYGTGGSSGVSRRYDKLRLAGATARELLISAAILLRNDSNTNRANYKAQHAAVVYTDPSTKAQTTYAYGTLAATAAQPAATSMLPNPIPLTDPSQFTLIGKPLPRVDLPSKVNGSAVYGIDVRVPGMVYAAIKHCPTFGGVMATAPATPSGALAVVPCKAQDNRGAVIAGTFNAVAVVANDTWTAKTLARSLNVTWTLPANTDSVDTAKLNTQAAQLMASGVPVIAEPLPAPPVATIEAAVGSAIASADPAKKLDATYSLPYVAHATMEVLNCTASVQFSAAGVPTGCEIWASNQTAIGAQNAAIAVIADRTGVTLPATAIKVHTTLLGGGLGRKIEQDYVSQAVQVSVVLKKPVKLTWMREEDFAHDNYRPTALIRVQAGLTASNNIAGMNYRVVTPSITLQRRPLAAGVADSQAVEGAVGLPYNMGTSVVEWVQLPAGIPVGYWRSVGASLNCFAMEAAIDELAALAKMDPFQFRYSLLTKGDTDTLRARAVLQAADALSSWRNTLPSGRAWGVALTKAFGTWVAEVVDISATTSSIKVNRVACVVDCGFAINPDSVMAQMQGGIVHGLNAALWGQINFVKGVSQVSNFNRSRMMRMNEMPQITVQVLQSSTTSPTGTGEPGVPPVAPALSNAYFRLTGKRVRTLPFFPGATMGD